MISVAPTLTMYVLTPLPVLSFIIYKISKIINVRSKVVQEYLSKLTTFAQESFSGVKIIKAYTLEKVSNNNLESIAHQSKEKNMNLVKVQSWFFPLMILLIGASNILVIYIGGLQYINGQIELGILAEFIIYVTMLTWPVATVGWVTSIVQQAEASQKRINEFLKYPVTKEKKSLRKKEVLGKIEFKNISFTYKETNIEALKNISFTIKPGESIAIMGDVGSGKSTILELISGVYKPTDGKIIVDNLDLNNYNISDFRNSIGYVPQTTFLFSDTIENNIKFGKHEATYEELINSSKSSCVHNDILSFDKEYKTLLG